MTSEQTPGEHTTQRDAVRLSLLREDSRADRRDMPRRKPVVAPAVIVPAPGAHVYVIPVVTENGPLL